MHKALSTYDYPLPIIINANWVNAVGIIRSLHLAGIPSISITKDRFGIGRFSNQTIGFQCPDYQESPERFLEFLLDLRSDLKHPGIIFPTDDTLLDTLVRLDSKIGGHFKRTYPRSETLNYILDKYNQYLSAKSAGVPVPYTIAPVCRSDLNDWPKELFPCVIKGRRGKAYWNKIGFQANLVTNKDELSYEFKKAGSIQVIIQEYIPGGDENLFGYTSYITESDKVIAEFYSQKLEQIPKNFGVMRCGVSNSKAPVASQSMDWLEDIGYTGLSYIEYKLDDRDGCYKLVELNARSWLNMFMATNSGINFPEKIYHHLTGKQEVRTSRQVDGVQWVSRVEEFFYVIGDLIRGRLNIKKRWENRPTGKDVILGWKDPLPAFFVPLYMIESYLKNRIKIRKLFSRRKS